MKRKGIQSALTAGLGVAAFATTIPAAYAQEGLEQVFVTARKRDEGVQAVPIAVTALSAEAMDQRGVKEVQDLNLTVPGFRFGAQGGRGNSDVILRGLSRIPVGEGMPAVVNYFANVALPARGSNIAMYDIANIQVLKGPQGTLFGRNTLGGAVSITPVAPTYEFGGYIRGAYGTKDNRLLEGAVNIPIVDEKVALRIAGQIHRQDGLTKNLSKDEVNADGQRLGGEDFQNAHTNDYRISLLLNPTDKIENTTVYDHTTAPEAPAAGIMFRLNPGTLAGLQAAFNFNSSAGHLNTPLGPNPFNGNFGDQLTAQLTDYYNRQQAAGFHASQTDIVGGGYSRRNLEGVSNDTTVDLGWATVRNILGYRKIHVTEAINTGTSGPISFDIGPAYGFPTGTPGFAGGFVLFDAAQVVGRSYLSDELQLFGTAFDDRLDWITGYYWNHDKSTEPQGSNFVQFGQPVSPITSHYENRNWAVFAQGGLDLSEWLLDGLKFNLGARYSVDKTTACGGPNALGYMSAGECSDEADIEAGAPGTFTGVGKGANNDEEASYTVGFDWQINPDTLVYITSRHGYRAANVNTPTFNTYYTTGGAGAIDPAYGATCNSPVLGPTACPDLTSLQNIKPEKITDYEVGVKNDWALGDIQGRVNAAAYWMKYKDAVQFVNFQAAGIPAPYSPASGTVGVNAADITVKGLEVDLTVIPVPSVVLSASGAITLQTVDSVSVPSITNISPYTENNVTLPSPKHSFSLAAAWTLPFQPLDGDVVVNGDVYYTSEFSGQDGESIPGYHVGNMRVSWNGIAKTGLNVAAFVKNVFNQEYFQSPIVLLQAFPMSASIPGDPRTWGVEATYKF